MIEQKWQKRAAWCAGLSAWRRSPHDASDHRVPSTASATSAIGSAQIGRCNERRNGRGSSVAASSGKPDQHADAHAAGRPRQQQRHQHRDEVDVEHARERVVPGRGHDRQHRADRVDLPARVIRRHHDDPAGCARALCCLAASVMPPATPTPSTYIHPSWKSTDVRVEQRGEDILHDDQQSDPGHQTLAAEQQQMHQPHRIEQDDRRRCPIERRRSSVWLCGLPMTWPWRDHAWRRSRPARTVRASSRFRGR